MVRTAKQFQRLCTSILVTDTRIGSLCRRWTALGLSPKMPRFRDQLDIALDDFQGEVIGYRWQSWTDRGTCCPDTVFPYPFVTFGRWYEALVSSLLKCWVFCLPLLLQSYCEDQLSSGGLSMYKAGTKSSKTLAFSPHGFYGTVL